MWTYREILIVAMAIVWLALAGPRLRRRRDLGGFLNRATWVPLVMAVLFVARCVQETRALLRVLAEAGAINEEQRVLFWNSTCYRACTLIALGTLLSGFLWALSRWGLRRSRDRGPS